MKAFFKSAKNSYMLAFSPMLCLTIFLLVVPAAWAEPVEETLDNPTFGKLMLYHAGDEPKGVVLFVSGAAVGIPIWRP